MKRLLILAALAALGACAKERAEEPAPQEAAAEAAPLTLSLDAPKATPAETLYMTLAGAWAEEGGCGDPLREWRLDPAAFHFGEMHCDILLHEVEADGARAIADCAVEGDNDGVSDSYRFQPQQEGGLAIVQEANGAVYAGLKKCGAAG